MPIEKSLQSSRPRQRDAPACQARSSHETNCSSSPSRRTRKCAETVEAADRREVRMRVPVERVGEQPLDRVAAVFAGRQADRMDHHQVDVVAAGRGAEVRRRDAARCAQPAAALPGAARRLTRVGAARVAADVDVEARHPVAHLAQRQAQADAGGGAVEAVVLERAHQDVALDVVEIPGEVVRQGAPRSAPCAPAARRPRAPRRPALGDLVELLRGAVGEDRLGQAEVVDVELLGAGSATARCSRFSSSRTLPGNG